MSKNKIDKQKSVTFQLVHRSQQDPLIADEDAPQRVLLPVKGKQKIFENLFRKQESNSIQEDEEHSDEFENENLDGVDKLQLPSTVFPSEIEEEIGMLGKAAPTSGPQLHLDPDVVAAMDEDFDYSDPENQLEDDFIALANGVGTEDDDIEYDSEDLDEVNSLLGSEMSFEKEETKSRFTNYSVSSSVIRRNGQLSLLDDRFEKMFIGYDENEIGALDCDEIEGDITANDILIRCVNDFEKSQNSDYEKKDVTNKIKQLKDSDEDEFEVIVERPKEKWDCESVLSNYSDIYNRPRLIVEPKDKIKINKRTGIPSNVFDANTLTARALKKLNENDKKPDTVLDRRTVSQYSVYSIRSKNESAEERRERKKKIKDFRRERRLERKINAEAFKEEAKRQVKIAINNRNNLGGGNKACTLNSSML